VVDALDLLVEKGELFSLLGVNGAGKTTILKMLSCISKPTSGDAYLSGESILSNPQKVKRLINVSPQETAIAPNLSVKENLELIAGIYSDNNKTVKEDVDQMIVTLKLQEVENSKAKILSGGWQRRLSIAMALITKPEILFLDEPTLGLDVLARRELWTIIKNLRGEITIILTTHYMEEAEALSDRIGIMFEGKLKVVGTAKELITEAKAENFEDAFVKFATKEGK
jgi:ABC-2 type transport system ATP-binding protein